MTRVVILANSVTELGGAQRVVHLLAQGLAERGHDVTAIGIVPTDVDHAFVERPAYRSRTLLTEPLPPPAPMRRRARLNPRHRRRTAERTMRRQSAVRELATELAAGQPGVLIVAQVWAMEHVAELTSHHVDLRAWRVITAYHGSFAAAAGGRDLARILRTCAPTDAFAALTKEDARAFRTAGLNNVVSMPNPLPFWPKIPANGTSTRLVFLGRLAVEKAPGLLLDAWQRMNADVPQWSLDVIGSGPMQASIAARAAELLRVNLLPPTSDAERALMQAGAFVLPSLAEGSPLALVEAMASGVPVVATDCATGVRELVVNDETGLLVRPADPGALARALRRLLTDGDLRARLAASARMKVADRTLESTLDRWERLFADVLR